MITNPEYLSKDRLKTELKSHGIKYNQNEKKDYYVMLYRKHVMEVEEPRHEFSSDEELTQRHRRPEKKQHSPKKRGKTVKIDAYLAEVQSLDDEELREELERHGKDVGPIIETTRSLYQRMLAKCMAENATGKPMSSRSVKPQEPSDEDEGVPANESFVGEWSSDESDTEEVVIAGRRPPARAPPSMGKGAREDVRDRSKRPPVEEPVEVSQESRRPRSRSKKHPSSKGSSSYYSFLVLLVMFAVAFFSYEHYTSTEEDPSLITRGWRKTACLWKDLQGYIVKSSPAPEPTAPTVPTTQGSGEQPPSTKPPPAASTPPPTEPPATPPPPPSEPVTPPPKPKAKSTSKAKTGGKKATKKDSGTKGKN